jgi:hypothetical protein
MTQEHHHVELVKGIVQEQKQILNNSGQAVYIYLDDTHKVCNKKFASMLGYKSAKEWGDTEAPLADVIEKDQARVIAAYEKASENLIAGSLTVTLKNIKTEKLIKTRVIMAPIMYNGHIFVIHFIEEV